MKCARKCSEQRERSGVAGVKAIAGQARSHQDHLTPVGAAVRRLDLPLDKAGSD
ncbi:hypothetical protein D9M71_489940 [compost metagenome]